MDDKRGNQSLNKITTHGHGAAMSGPSMNKAMFRQVHRGSHLSFGIFRPLSGRRKRLIAEKERGESSCKRKKFWEL
jgi:hypothetical protein